VEFKEILIDDVILAKEYGLKAILYKDFESLKKELVSFSININ